MRLDVCCHCFPREALHWLVPKHFGVHIDSFKGSFYDPCLSLWGAWRVSTLTSGASETIYDMYVYIEIRWGERVVQETDFDFVLVFDSFRSAESGRRGAACAWERFLVRVGLSVEDSDAASGSSPSSPSSSPPPLPPHSSWTGIETCIVLCMFGVYMRCAVDVGFANIMSCHEASCPSHAQVHLRICKSSS